MIVTLSSADDWFCPTCVKEGKKGQAIDSSKNKKESKKVIIKEEELSEDADSEEDESDASKDESEDEDDREVDRVLYIRRAKSEKLPEVKSEEDQVSKKEPNDDTKEEKKDKKTTSKKTEGFGSAIEILVKWKDQSYTHCEWIDEPTMLRLARAKYLNYLRSLVRCTSSIVAIAWFSYSLLDRWMSQARSGMPI